MDIHKLKHTSEQIESVLHMATDMVPSSYTSEFDLPQWNEEDSKRLNILQILSDAYSKIDTAISGVDLSVSEITELYSEINQQVSSIETQVVSNTEGIEGNTAEIGNLQLKSDEFSTKIAKNTEDIAVNAEKYSQVKQTIARLKVDSLSTSRRIPKYLDGDTTDDNYIDIQDQHIALRRAWTDGSTEQARDDFGALLYWEKSVSNATIGTDGYPYVDGQRVFTTTSKTSWPVMVYKYESGDRLRFYFVETEDGSYGPRQIWGEGRSDGTAVGKGYIEKLGLSFDVYNMGTDGVKRGIFMGDDFVDISGLRQTAKLDVSKYDEGLIVETLDGDIVNELRLNFNTEGDPTIITNSAGHSMEVVW